MRAFHELPMDEPDDLGSGVALVLDGDRTLGPSDTGRLVGALLGVNDEIRRLFENEGYTESSFRRHAAIWSQVPLADYLAAVAAVAAGVDLYDAWKHLLARHSDVCVRVVTAGVPQVWRAALARCGLDHVEVIGGLHLGVDSYIVTPACKAAIVEDLKASGMWVMAAGDSEIDLDMLARADLAVWVADDKGSVRLQRRLHEVPGIVRLVTDSRELLPWPALTVEALDERLLAMKGRRHVDRSE